MPESTFVEIAKKDVKGLEEAVEINVEVKYHTDIEIPEYFEEKYDISWVFTYVIINGKKHHLSAFIYPSKIECSGRIELQAGTYNIKLYIPKKYSYEIKYCGDPEADLECCDVNPDDPICNVDLEKGCFSTPNEAKEYCAKFNKIDGVCYEGCRLSIHIKYITPSREYVEIDLGTVEVKPKEEKKEKKKRKTTWYPGKLLIELLESIIESLLSKEKE